MKSTHKILHRIFVFIRICIILTVCLVLAAGIVLCVDYMRRFMDVYYQNLYKSSRHWEAVGSADSFTESAAPLSNPDRGTYLIYGFTIADQAVNYPSLVADRFKNDRSNTLAMIQINLRNYREGEISETGLANIAELFDALRSVTGKRLLVRFLYDWDGKNLETEPESLDIILAHIRQLEPVLRDNSDQIFVLQGLFLGNWGEMNGSKFLSNDNFKLLAGTLSAVTDDSTFLAVRMPAQWRAVTGLADITADSLSGHPFAQRLSLYNDGIMGNQGDYGTYGTRSRAQAGDFTLWNRDEELAFQNQLCCYVPNGGEVIIDNVFNDFENALPTLRQMRLTYFNEDYDRNVFQKWEQTVINDGSVYDGMDGYTYIKRHLGSRLLIDSADMAYQVEDDSMTFRVNMRNAGFAPLYGDKECRLILQYTDDGHTGSTHEASHPDAKSSAYYVYPFEEDITSLSRTADETDSFTLLLKLPLTKLPAGAYTVSFQLWDNDTDRQLQLAIETPQTSLGYGLGTFTIAEPDEPSAYPELPDLPFDLDSRIEELLRPASGGGTNKLWQWLDRLYPQR